MGEGEGPAYHRRSFYDTRRNPRRRFVVEESGVVRVVALEMGC